VALARSGSVVFWKTSAGEGGEEAAIAGGAGDPGIASDPPLRALPLPDGAGPATLLLALVTAVALLAGPLTRYTDATAAQLADPDGYIGSVLGAPDPAPSSLEEAP
ncbi:MAG: hypothetical protein RQ745_14140, partial [Longimicrobiales bacterium]|nr:hypothetical protein [Longimicrobiales bacterium]